MRVGRVVGCLALFGVLGMCVLGAANDGGSRSADRGAVDVMVADAARRSVSERMRDPGSTQFKDVRVVRSEVATVACGWVNARNGFGGYSGFQPFISNGGGITVLRGDVASERDFADTWARLCK